ncbi:MAG: VanZ family protein [Planctomycetaceae bacterium]
MTTDLQAPLGERAVNGLTRRLVLLSLGGYWIALFVATHVPMPDLGDAPTHSDKVMHLTAYAGLSVLLMAWIWSTRAVRPKHFLAVWVIVACYGVTDELLQGLVGRQMDVKDWLADIVGAGLGLTACAIVGGLLPALNRKRRARSSA